MASRHIERGGGVAIGLRTADASLMAAEHVVVFPCRRRRGLTIDGPETGQSDERARGDALERGGQRHINEILAALEGEVADARHALGQLDEGDAGAEAEGHGRNGGDIVGGAIDSNSFWYDDTSFGIMGDAGITP